MPISGGRMRRQEPPVGRTPAIVAAACCSPPQASDRDLPQIEPAMLPELCSKLRLRLKANRPNEIEAALMSIGALGLCG